MKKFNSIKIPKDIQKTQVMDDTYMLEALNDKGKDWLKNNCDAISNCDDIVTTNWEDDFSEMTVEVE